VAFPPLPSNLAVYKRFGGTNQAAGSEISEVVPTGKSWFLVSLSVALAQGITQTPQPILVIDDGTNVVYESLGSSAVQAVSTTTQYTWAVGLSLTGQVGAAAAVHSHGSLPWPMLLSPGWRIRTVTLGIGANSDYGVPNLFVIEVG
jgi:hypothetical protein